MFEQLQEAVEEGPKPQEVKVVNVQKAENKNQKIRDYPRRDSWGAIQSSNCQARKFKVKKKET